MRLSGITFLFSHYKIPTRATFRMVLAIWNITR